MFSLKDKIALVTGASQGIGRATSLLLAEAGAKIAVAARTAASNSSPKELAKCISRSQITFEKQQGLLAISAARPSNPLLKKCVERSGRLLRRWQPNPKNTSYRAKCHASTPILKPVKAPHIRRDGRNIQRQSLAVGRLHRISRAIQQ